MIETVTRKVDPKDEQQTINIMSLFCWNLASSQEINSAESHLERRNDTIYSVTTRENYVKLVFQRNTNRKNYSRIVELEKQYHHALNLMPILPQWQMILSIMLGFFTLPICAIPGIMLFLHYRKKFGRFTIYETNKDRPEPTPLI